MMAMTMMAIHPKSRTNCHAMIIVVIVIVVIYLYKGSALLRKASRSPAASPAL